jgi:adenylate kinase family enzyme
MTLGRIAILASASGSGKTTLARALAARLGATFIELDAFQHGPDWTAVPADELRAKLAPLLARERWVIDGFATQLGTVVEDNADLIVWLDLPLHVWLPRLALRSARRLLFREVLWNGNRETLRGVFVDQDSVFRHALRAFFVRRRHIPARLARFRVVRLCSVREVEAFLTSFPHATDQENAAQDGAHVRSEWPSGGSG